MKINVSAGMLWEWGARLGLVCRDEEELIVGCAVVQQGVQWESRVAEAKAVLAGM